jgi:hypothetical protein
MAFDVAKQIMDYVSSIIDYVTSIMFHRLCNIDNG